VTEAETNDIESAEGHADGDIAPANNIVALPAREKSNADTVKEFVRDHPVAVVVGGIALGLIAASLLPKGSGRRMARRAADMADTLAAAGLLYSQQAWERAESAGHDLRDAGYSAAGRAQEFGESAADRMHDFISPAAHRAASAGHRVVAKAQEIRSRVRR
jgi:hypothetical protein